MSASNPQHRIVRPVGTTQIFNTSRHSLGLYRCVITACRYTLPVASLRKPYKAAVEDALAAVIMRHDILRVGIIDEDKKMPSFVQLPTIDMREMIEWKRYPENIDHDEWLMHSIAAQHDKLWEGLDVRPGWKIVAHEAASANDVIRLDLVFAYHHSYSDGPSSLIFHRDLLRALNSSSGAPPELQDHVLHLPKPPVPPRGFEDVVPFQISWGFFLSKVWSEILYPMLVPTWLRPTPDPGRTPWTGGIVKAEPFKSHCRLISVSDATVQALRAACRAQGTTLTPALHALFTASLASRLPANEAPTFEAWTPISLRPWALPEIDRENTIHCLVTGHEILFEPATIAALRQRFEETKDHKTTPVGDPESAVWNIAIEVRTSFRARIAQTPKDDIISLVKYVPDWHQRWLDRIGKEKQGTYELSNCGKISAEDSNRDSEGWKIDRAMFTQGAAPVAPGFNVSVVGVEGEGLWLTVGWQDTSISDELMEGLTADVQKWLDTFARNGRFGMFD